jgi:hypothetical protein
MVFRTFSAANRLYCNQAWACRIQMVIKKSGREVVTPSEKSPSGHLSFHPLQIAIIRKNPQPFINNLESFLRRMDAKAF